MPHAFFSARLAVLLLLTSAIFVSSIGQAAAPRIYALTDVRIVTEPGKVIENGTIVLRDGLIESVGANIDPPADAKIIPGEENWTVYPAFIDAAASVGLNTEAESQGEKGRSDGRNGKETRPGSPHELEAVRPEVSVVDQLVQEHSSIDRHRQSGFAVAHTLPAKGVFRGESAVLLLREAPTRELILDDRAAQVVALEKSSFFERKYPSSSIGAMATVRQTLLDARRQQQWEERYAKNPEGMPHPEFRSSDAPLISVLQQERLVVFVAGAGLDPGRFGGLAEQFELRGMTVAMHLGHRSDYLAAANMPILLPLEMPDKPALENGDEVLNAKLDELQAYLRAPGLPNELAEAGIQFAFVTLGMQSVRDFNKHLAQVVEAGLPADQALAAVTTAPARLLNIERITGTLTAGKQANLFVVDGELFSEKPKLRHLFVNGYHEEFAAEETIGDPDAVEDPTGTWEITSEVMGRSSESTWTISGKPDNYRGFSESSRAGKRDFSSVSLKGNALTIISETPQGELEMTVIVTGDALAGKTTMESARGSATMSIDGRRVSAPEQNQL